MSLLLFSLAVSSYFFLHSLLAAESVKSFLTARLIPARYYRLFYNILAIVLLVPVVWMYFITEKEMLLEHPWFSLPGGMLLLGGGIWIFKALQGYDLGEFSGLHQLRESGLPPQPSLHVGGLNRLVRHPLYFGILLAVWGLFLLLPAGAMLVTAGISTVYLYTGSWLEERKLTQQFGDAYRSYQENVPMLLPFKFRGGKN